MVFGVTNVWADASTETTTVTYALEVGETHAAGETVEVKNGNEVVATLTFGFAGGADFTAAVADSHIPGFVASTGGNGENGKPDSGTNYIINPKYDGQIEVGVILNADKAFSILEDGAALADYDGIKVAEKYYGTFTFDVKAGKEYKVYCAGSKLGFYGFNYTFAAEGGDATPGLALPITEDFEGETSIFEGGELFDAADLGHVLLVKNTMATADLAGYTPAENEKVTVKFTAYQGWVSGGTFVVALKNTEEKDLVSYTYDCGPCNVTNVAIGGTTVEGFEAFFGQSNSTNAASKGSANIFGHASQPFVATEGYNPQVTMSVTGTGLVEFNFQYMAYNSTEINVTYSEQLPEGTKIDLCCLVLTATGNANSFGIDNLSITSAEAGDQPGDESVRRWDFTNWSEKTVANLIADAALGTKEGWSDDEKNDGSNMDATAGNCFWAITTPNENGELLANGEVIEELKGLVFGENVNNRGMAIAVNYPETSLGTYHGPAYLWLGGKNKEFFTIPAVAGGSTIKMGVESHKPAEGRGVQLKVNGAVIDGPAVPGAYEEQTWTIPAGETVDVVVDNTNGCHIYFIEVTAGEDIPTSIIETVKPKFEDGAIYNLQGQKVQKAQKGLYIINGKKVLVK